MRLVFMGSPDFAVPSLMALSTAGHEIIGVFTQPDKPKGRGKELAPTAVKKAALELGITVYTPASVRTAEVYEILKNLAPEIIVVVAYGKIIPKEILDLPIYGCVNVHASLLPYYRGAAPIHRAIINGDTITGVTTMHMDVGLDTGDMIYNTEVLISKKDTVGHVHDKLASSGAALIVLTLEALKKGVAPRLPQDDSLATYAPLLSKADEELDWSQSATEIVNRVRGMNPYPGTFTLFRGEILKTLQVEADELAHQAEPGIILTADVKKGMLVACGKEAVWLKEVQAKSGKRMSSDAFVRGYKVSEGEILKR